jgi:peptidoglycan/LPS O-acetylase OafA/YrhL
MVITAALLRYFLALHGIQVFYLTFTRIDGLAAGALVAVYHRERLLSGQSGLFSTGVIASASLLFAVSYIGRGRNLPWFIAVKYSIVTWMYSFFLAWILSRRNSSVHSLLKLRPLRFVGRISYGLYVFHPAIFLLAFDTAQGENDFFKGLLGFAMAFCAAVMSWYGFERYFIKLKDRWAPDRKSPMEAPADI